MHPWSLGGLFCPSQGQGEWWPLGFDVNCPTPFPRQKCLGRGRRALLDHPVANQVPPQEPSQAEHEDSK